MYIYIFTYTHVCLHTYIFYHQLINLNIQFLKLLLFKKLCIPENFLLKLCFDVNFGRHAEYCAVGSTSVSILYR